MDRYRIEQMKELAKLKKRCKEVVPEIYACLIKVLYDRGIDVDVIADICAESQEVWMTFAEGDNKQRMIEWVIETTGIDIEGKDYVGDE